MTATAEPRVDAAPAATRRLNRAEGIELLGPVHGCGYRDGASLVRRPDGQMIQLGALMYGLLECADGSRDADQLAAALSERLGRGVEAKHVARIGEKLAAQGLLAGSEHHAPPRRNPLLALRWKVLVTDPKWTRRLTAPFTILLRPWLMWPALAAFAGVFWFVLIHKGVASATAQAFHKPGLLLLVFALAVASAGFHELGHAAACRYGGATPGGMGMGLYLVWPAFYTDVTDAYRLPKRSRLRIDLAGLYFNVVVADVTMAVWLAWRSDALLLLIALQILQMVKQLSPVIRADGYHILSDATGVPDLYSHIGPTLRRLVPGHRGEPSALTGRARALVTIWVLVVVPVLLSLMLGAILLFPKLATTAWDSAHQIVNAIPHQADHGQILDLLASLVRLLALALPVFGTAMISQKVFRMAVSRARTWSYGRPGRQGIVLTVTAAVLAALLWAWWPSGQYRPIRANQNGTLGGLVTLVSDPVAVARPAPALAAVTIPPGPHLAMSMIPVGGATKQHPALFVISRGPHKPPLALVLASTPRARRRGPAASSIPMSSGGATVTPSAGATGSGGTATTSTTAGVPSGSATTSSGTATTAPSSSGPGTSAPSGLAATPTKPAAIEATAFPFALPAAPGPGGTQALAVNTTDGGVKYTVAYSLLTVEPGAAVTNTNSAYAIASCRGCATVAVSFQVVLVIGQTHNLIAPINAAGSLNYACPACTTTAIADQLVITLRSQPSAVLVKRLDAALQSLGALPNLGAAGTPAAVAAAVGAVQSEIEAELASSGLLEQPLGTTSASGTPTPAASVATTSTGSSTTSTPGATTTPRSSTTPAATPTTPATSTTSTHVGAGSSTSTSSATTSTPATTPPAGATTPSPSSAGSASTTASATPAPSSGTTGSTG